VVDEPIDQSGCLEQPSFVVEIWSGVLGAPHAILHAKSPLVGATYFRKFVYVQKQLQSRVPSRILSDKERERMDELALVESKISVKEEIGVSEKKAKEPWERYVVIKSLTEDLVEHRLTRFCHS
jgi:hypothetical protein